jgi:hypothetical protein
MDIVNDFVNKTLDLMENYGFPYVIIAGPEKADCVRIANKLRQCMLKCTIQDKPGMVLKIIVERI